MDLILKEKGINKLKEAIKNGVTKGVINVGEIPMDMALKQFAPNAKITITLRQAKPISGDTTPSGTPRYYYTTESGGIKLLTKRVGNNKDLPFATQSEIDNSQ